MNKKEIAKFRRQIYKAFGKYYDVYEGVKMANFSIDTGINHGDDDLVDVCFPYIEKIIGTKIDKRTCLRLEVNRNSQGVVGMMLSYQIQPKKAVSLIVMDDGRAFLLREATHKPYLYVLENGNPLAVFAFAKLGGGCEIIEGEKERRGLFDGRHYFISKKMTSCLPSKIRLKINGSDYESFYFTCKKNRLVFTGGRIIKSCQFKEYSENKKILIPQVNII